MKVIPFYLPQFHRIAENDAWWGEGFTEWTNVRKAKALYEGHNQPREPLNDNYYDLSHTDTLRWQADLAKKYGIFGFCFYHYWFNGKLLLEKPMELLLANPDINLNFCISWANENWTNGWVSDENSLLVGHDFDDEEDWKKHFVYLLNFFKDPRYIKEDGMPLLVIYVPHHIGKIRKMIDAWRVMAVENGLPGIKFIYQHPGTCYDQKFPHEIFDYGIEFQPQFEDFSATSKVRRNIFVYGPKISAWIQRNLGVYLRFRSKRDALTIKNYELSWQRILQRPPLRKNMIPTAFVDWDNTPRKGRRGSVYEGANPAKFENFFRQLVRKARTVYKTDKIFVFAWNEWAEGGYLEPDTNHAYGYLEAISAVLASEGFSTDFSKAIVSNGRPVTMAGDVEPGPI